MRGIKPFKLSFITRPFSWGQSHHLGVGVLAYFPLQSEQTLLTDQEMWMEVPEVLGKEFAIDLGIPKSRSELLMAATAYQPAGVPAPLRHVRAQVGDIVKSLYVVGDRFWNGERQTEPIPFTQMPITWDRAFGGEGYARNPGGRGFAPVEIDGVELHPLPNIECAGAMIQTKKDRPDPASFRPIDFISPDRLSMAGTYDKRWLDTRFPGFAEDMNWRIWNAAPPDQQQEQPFRGDERIVLEHLHPTKERLEARLPGISARAFVTQRAGEDEDAVKRFHEIPLKLTTIWLLPDIERGILVFHGAHPIVEDDAHDIDTIMVAGERLGAAPRPLAHYQSVLARRLGPEGVFEALNDYDLMPEGFDGLGSTIEHQLELTTMEQLRLKRQRKYAESLVNDARAKCEALGLDPDVHGPKAFDAPPPDEDMPLSEVAAAMRSLAAQVEEKKAEAERIREENMKTLADLCAATGLDLDEMKAEMENTPTGPPNFSAAGQQAKMRALADEAQKATGKPLDELEFYATDETVYAAWVSAEAQFRQAYRMTAHLQRAAPGAPPPASSERREAVMAAHARGESLAEWDLTGVDLSGLDLSGADLRSAFLESTDLSAASLDRARLGGAVLAHANLRGASLNGADLSKANLGGADLSGASVVGANLAEVVLVGARLTATDLSEANLPEADLDGVALDDTRFVGANLSHARFQTMSIGSMQLSGADLTHALFFEVDARGIDFSGACMEDATFYKSRAEGARFVDCRMPRFRAIETSFAGADFKRAAMDKALLRGLDLVKADFSGARLDLADFSGANLEDAVLYRIVARQSMWVRAKLRRAQMISADLFEAILEKADLRGADLRGANLYGANLALMRADADTTVEEAIRDRVRVLPLREGA